MLKYFGWMLLGLLVVFLLIVPTAFSFLVPLTGYSQTLFRWMQPIEFVQKILIHVLTMGWMFFVGGCLASFLNVVAWRVPRGKSILGSS
ncbi:prepilin peptidase, partial [Mariniblastus sp.]|nr:prepilin peptidase [Mariniblastus sp.]